MKNRINVESILLAQEIALDAKVESGNIAIKLDMEKTYDKMECEFTL